MDTSYAGSSTIPANTIRLYQFIPTRTFTSDLVALQIGTIGAGGTAKVVIYSSDADGAPDSLILETATMSTATATIVSVALSHTFVAGTTYWIGVRCSVSTGFQCWPSQSVPDVQGSTAPVTSLVKAVHRSVSYGTAAPTPWVWSSTEIGAGPCCAIWFRRA